MAEPARMITGSPTSRPLAFSRPPQLAVWGAAAAAALLLALLSAHSSAGSQRDGKPASPPWASILAELAKRTAETEGETRRLSETVAALTAERDRALARLAALERNLEDITGTIKRQPANPPAPPAPSSPPPSASSLLGPAPLASREEIAPNTEAAGTLGPAAPAMPGNHGGTVEMPPQEPAQAKAELAIDVGGGTSFDALRALWNETRSIDPELFKNLQPRVIARETRARVTDLRLIVGPLPGLDAATRLCVALSVERHYCQPTAFDGQVLLLAAPEAEPDLRAPPPKRKTAPTASPRAPAKPKV